MTEVSAVLAVILSATGTPVQAETALSVEQANVVFYTQKMIDSRFGQIARLQSILNEVCDSPGLVRALLPVRERAARDFFDSYPEASGSESGLSWLTSIAGQSYAEGIKDTANIALKAEGDDLMRDGLCKGYKRAAETFLNAAARETPP